MATEKAIFAAGCFWGVEQDGLSRPIATEITQASTFWPAEEYHQRYFEKHGFVGCHIPEFK